MLYQFFVVGFIFVCLFVVVFFISKATYGSTCFMFYAHDFAVKSKISIDLKLAIL